MMADETGIRKRRAHDDEGEKQHKEGKIGSWYMSTVKGQPFLKDTVEVTSKTDRELRPRELKE